MEQSRPTPEWSGTRNLAHRFADHSRLAAQLSVLAHAPRMGPRAGQPLYIEERRGALPELSAILYSKGDIQVKLRERFALTILFVGIQWLTTGSALAQTRGGAVTIRYTTFSPFIALLAGILILIAPRLLNYIVAIYLILVGLIGIFGV